MSLPPIQARPLANAANPGPAHHPDHPDPLDHPGVPNHHKIVHTAVFDQQRFIRAVFSGRLRGHALPWKRVLVRPIDIQGTLHLQFTYYDAARSIDKNLAGPAAESELRSLLQLPFQHVHLFLVDREVHVTLTQKGRATVRSVKKAIPTERTLSHDRQKRLPLPPGRPDPYLVATGIATPEGRIKADRYDKFRQVNEFLRLLGQTVSSEPLSFPRTVVDFGCGNAYLTFATYHYFHTLLNHPLEMTGVDQREAPLVTHRAKAAQLGWDRLTFVASSIADFTPSAPPDLVLSLHACDTATDDALARAIQWRSRYIFSVPCCHHHLQQQLRRRQSATPLRPVHRDGVLSERLGDVLTDTLRALILRICGYRTDVVQFVSTEHTAKNLMIRASLTPQAPTTSRTAIREYLRLRDFLQVTPYLETLLGPHLQNLLTSAAAPG